MTTPVTCQATRDRCVYPYRHGPCGASESFVIHHGGGHIANPAHNFEAERCGMEVEQTGIPQDAEPYFKWAWRHVGGPRWPHAVVVEEVRP